jgi:hypothetical protein
MRLTVDECVDANGHWTIRPADGTPNGDIDAQPIATFYVLEHAERYVRLHNIWVDSSHLRIHIGGD